MNSKSTLIQQVRILDPVSNTDRIGDVLIDDFIIKHVGTFLKTSLQDENTNIIDGQGLILAPGLVDLYSHSSEPGYEERETLATLAEAAAAGGFTRIAILPDTKPAIDNPSVIELLQQQRQKVKAKLARLPHIYYWGAVTCDLEGKQMTELAELAEGVIGFTDGYPIENLSLLRQLLEYVKPLGKPLALTPGNKNLQGDGVMREGEASIRYGLPGNPGVAEAVAIASILELVGATNTPVHLMRVSTRRGVELIADAKERGLEVTASTTWMHLLLDTDAVDIYDPNLRLEPPLGNPSDRQALVKGVKQGIIDAIAVDHSPYTYEEKTLAFAEAPGGAIGLELILPLLWENFVATGEWTAIELWQALSTKPQRCWQQQLTAILPEQKAELILFDPNAIWTVDRQNLKSLSSNTPWYGKQLTGRVLQIWN
ncbi:MAG: dihydroorotase [Xenococcaceae cyanobacterium]